MLLNDLFPRLAISAFRDLVTFVKGINPLLSYNRCGGVAKLLVSLKVNNSFRL